MSICYTMKQFVLLNCVCLITIISYLQVYSKLLFTSQDTIAYIDGSRAFCRKSLSFRGPK